MKRNFLNITLLAFLSIFILASCSDDDEGEKSLVGAWTYQSIEFEFFVDGQDFIEYFTDELDYTEKEAAEEADKYKVVGEVFKDVNFTFNSDGTYEVFGQTAGTWTLNDDETELIFDQGTPDESVLQVFELTSKKLSIGIDQDMQEDLDEDGSLEEISIKFILTFTK